MLEARPLCYFITKKSVQEEYKTKKKQDRECKLCVSRLCCVFFYSKNVHQYNDRTRERVCIYMYMHTSRNCGSGFICACIKCSDQAAAKEEQRSKERSFGPHEFFSFGFCSTENRIENTYTHMISNMLFDFLTLNICSIFITGMFSCLTIVVIFFISCVFIFTFDH